MTKVIKVKIYYESKLLNILFPKWVNGVTVGSHIFYRSAAGLVPATTMNHELIHVCQYADRGIHTFLWEYLWVQRDLAYRRKTAEIEAYAHEADPGYIARRWPNYKITIE